MNILVADDELHIRQLVGELLEDAGHNVTLAEDGEDALEKFSREWHDIVFSDIRMPKMSGIQLLQEVKKISDNTQFIIMTSYASVDSSIAALKQGAFDYIIKPFDDLDIVIDAAVRAMENLSGIRRQERLLNTLSRQNEELGDLNKQFRELAIRDGLTGLYNHRHAQDVLKEEFKRAVKFDRALAVLFLDVDHFKVYNDTHGHQAGDLILGLLGGLMQQSAPQSSTVTRWGGEEFVIIAPEMTLGQATEFAESIRRKVEKHDFPDADEQPLGHLSLSIGVAARDGSVDNMETLLRYADDAVYEAKEKGRNRTVFMCPESRKPVLVET